MEKESVQLILDYLDKIAAKLGTSAEQIWPWFIREQYVEAIYYSIVAIVLVIVFVFVLRCYVKYWDRGGGYSIRASDHELLWIIGVIILGFITTIFIILGIAEFPDIFNPEYHALQSIISMAK